MIQSKPKLAHIYGPVLLFPNVAWLGSAWPKAKTRSKHGPKRCNTLMKSILALGGALLLLPRVFGPLKMLNDLNDLLSFMILWNHRFCSSPKQQELVHGHVNIGIYARQVGAPIRSCIIYVNRLSADCTCSGPYFRLGTEHRKQKTM